MLLIKRFCVIYKDFAINFDFFSSPLLSNGDQLLLAFLGSQVAFLYGVIYPIITILLFSKLSSVFHPIGHSISVCFDGQLYPNLDLIIEQYYPHNYLLFNPYIYLFIFKVFTVLLILHPKKTLYWFLGVLKSFYIVYLSFANLLRSNKVFSFYIEWRIKRSK